MVLIYVRSKTPELTHIGFSVSKKLGNSVCRNRIKRRLRSVMAPLISSIKPGYDIIVIAREPIAKVEFAGIEAAARSLLRRGDLMKKEEK